MTGSDRLPRGLIGPSDLTPAARTWHKIHRTLCAHAHRASSEHDLSPVRQSSRRLCGDLSVLPGAPARLRVGRRGHRHGHPPLVGGTIDAVRAGCASAACCQFGRGRPPRPAPRRPLLRRWPQRRRPRPCRRFPRPKPALATPSRRRRATVFQRLRPRAISPPGCTCLARWPCERPRPIVPLRAAGRPATWSASRSASGITSSSCSARAAWARSTRPWTTSWASPWRSRRCARNSPPIRRRRGCSTGASSRNSCWRARSRTRTSSGCTTSASWTA